MNSKEELKYQIMRKRLQSGDVTDMIPDVDGHRLTLQQWIGFSEFTRTGNGKAAARVAGVSANTMYKWSKSDWWRNLQRDHVEIHMDSFYMKMSGAAQKIFDAYMKIIEGTWPEPKTANAVIKAVELFMRMGKGGTEPILNSRPFIEMHKTINNIQINTDKLAMVWETMEDEERQAFHQTGELPLKYRAELSDNPEDVSDDIELTAQHVALLEGEEDDYSEEEEDEEDEQD